MAKDSGQNYVKLIIYLIMAFGSFVGGATFGYFAFAGLTYGQAVFEVDVKGDRYTYECLTNCDDPATATYNTSDTLDVQDDYVAVRNEVNDNTVLFLGAFTIVFSLLTLVFLMLALRESGLTKKEGSSKSQY